MERKGILNQERINGVESINETINDLERVNERINELQR
jgi:hypothetical protein